MNKWTDIPEFPTEAVAVMSSLKEYIASLLLRMHRTKPKRAAMIESTLDYLKTKHDLSWALYGSYAWNHYLPYWMQSQPSDADVYIFSASTPLELKELAEQILQFLPIVYEGFSFSQKASLNNGDSTLGLFCEDIHFMDLSLSIPQPSEPYAIDKSPNGDCFVPLAKLLSNLEYVLQLPSAKYRHQKDLLQLTKIYHAYRLDLLPPLLSQSVKDHLLTLSMQYQELLIETGLLRQQEFDFGRELTLAKAEINRLSLVNCNLESKVDNLTQEVSRNQSKFDSIREKLNKRIKTQSSLINQSKADSQRLSAELHECKEQNKSLTEQNKCLQDSNQTLVTQLEDNKGILAQVKSEMQTTLKQVSSNKAKANTFAKKKKNGGATTKSADKQFDLGTLQFNYRQALDLLAVKDNIIRSLNEEHKSLENLRDTLGKTLRQVLAEKNDIASLHDFEKSKMRTDIKRLEKEIESRSMSIYEHEVVSAKRAADHQQTRVKWDYCIDRISFAYATLLYNRQIAVAGMVPLTGRLLQEISDQVFCQRCQLDYDCDNKPATLEALAPKFIFCSMYNNKEKIPFSEYLSSYSKKLRMALPTRKEDPTHIVEDGRQLLWIPMIPTTSESLKDEHHGGYRIELVESSDPAIQPKKWAICQDCLLHNLFAATHPNHDDVYQYDFPLWRRRHDELISAIETHGGGMLHNGVDYDLL